jgi:outer membrane protein, multidrug efflux system
MKFSLLPLSAKDTALALPRALYRLVPIAQQHRVCVWPFVLLLLVSLAALICSCAVGPDYKKPEIVDTPTDYRWKKAEPRDGDIKPEWWLAFKDDDLNALVKQAIYNNQQLRIAVSRVEQSRAKARINAAEFFPTLGASPTAMRARNPAIGQILPAGTTDIYAMPLDLSYEVDLWGRVRRSFEAAQAEAAATAANSQNVLLVLTSDVVANYYVLRAYDAQADILQRTLELRKKEVDLQTKRFSAGLISDLDVQRAKAEKSATESDLADIRRRRAETEASLAVLCGQPASNFQIQTKAIIQNPPEIPVGLPSALLERRPDVAAAEREMAARNAQIGVAYAAFFPSVRLTGQGGYVSTDTSDLFSWENHFWAFGPSISIPLFEGGRNAAGVKQARAAYEESVASYRQQVLVAFKDVEVALIQIRFYKEQADSNLDAYKATQRSVFLAAEQYRHGSLNYLDVIEAQRNLLARELEISRIHGQRMVASVKLVEALGGGWSSPQPAK